LAADPRPGRRLFSQPDLARRILGHRHRLPALSRPRLAASLARQPGHPGGRGDPALAHRFHRSIHQKILARRALSALFIGAPIFFAATLFASAFASRKESGLSFGWNLLGAVAGGLLEFLTMLVGIKALHLIALTLYLAVALVRSRHVRQRA
jgi:hypothetical protein